MEAKMEAYDDEGNVLETTSHRAWFTWAEAEVDLIIVLPRDAQGRNVQLLIPRKKIVQALVEHGY